MNRHRYLIIILLFLYGHLTNAQARYFGFGDSSKNIGFQTVEALDDECTGNNIDQNSLPYRVVSDILKQMGIYDFNFKLRECPNLKNAMAQTLPNENGNRTPYIVYGKDWLKQLSSSTRNWEAIGVLAHEVGHLQKLHVITGSGSKPNLEIEADRFLGAQLAKMGASLSQAQSCLRLTSIKGSRTHPPRKERLEAVELGWSRARLESANQLTIDTKLSDVTSQLILDRFSKELGGYQVLNRIKKLDYKVKVSETRTLQNNKTKSFDYLLKIDLNAMESQIIDSVENEKYRLVHKTDMTNDSVFYKRPISSKTWIKGAPQIGTGTLFKKEDHHFAQENKPTLKMLFDHFQLANNPDLTRFDLRTRFEGQECYVLSLPQQVIRKEEKNRNWFRATIKTKNYYSWQYGQLVGSVQEESIEYFNKKNKPLVKNNKQWVRTLVFGEYYEFEGLKLPSKITRIIQEKDGSVLKSERKIEQVRSIDDLNISYNE